MDWLISCFVISFKVISFMTIFFLNDTCCCVDNHACVCNYYSTLQNIL